MAYVKKVEVMYAEHKYLTFDEPRIGADRSIPQNGLLHVWLAEYAAFILKIDKRDVYEGILEGMKLDAKKRFLLDNPDSSSWMVHEVKGPLSGRIKKAYTSSASWGRGEAYVFLTWLQMLAANDGLILESRGQFAKLQRKEDET